MSNRKNKDDQLERRAYVLQDFEVREGNEDEGPKIGGYAAVFNQLSENLGGFVEKIDPGAFTKTLKEGDPRALMNHNSDHVLGRKKAGTLRLDEDKKGLAFEIDLPDTQIARDLKVSMERGDIDQMSFLFKTRRDEWDESKDPVVRTLKEVELIEVSPVTFPAYPQTSAQVRSKMQAIQEARAAAPGQEAHPAGSKGEEEERQGPPLDNLRRRVELAEKL